MLREPGEAIAESTIGLSQRGGAPSSLLHLSHRVAGGDKIIHRSHLGAHWGGHVGFRRACNCVLHWWWGGMHKLGGDGHVHHRGLRHCCDADWLLECLDRRLDGCDSDGLGRSSNCHWDRLHRDDGLDGDLHWLALPTSILVPIHEVDEESHYHEQEGRQQEPIGLVPVEAIVNVIARIVRILEDAAEDVSPGSVNEDGWGQHQGDD
mmetsp:Transcript_45567/g.71395  ORF Transcript_45567/g.71395 Transcript_45567/m.71395 type:complete len:207 (-) Transcript_45567:465-1085(-)